MRIGIVGGGAAGMMAAIAAAKEGAVVTIIEKNARIGKKILATGNGKCNFTNISMKRSDYYSQNNNIYDDYISQFDQYQVLCFFEKHGMMYKNKNGYCYPRCEQASVVLDILRKALAQHNVEILTEQTPVRIEKKGASFFVFCAVGGVTTARSPLVFDRLILACGSPAGQKEFSIPSGYTYAESFGHSFVPLRPALVSLRCRDQGFSAIAGVRCEAEVLLYENECLLARERGELQLTAYGISGIPVFQLSRHVKPPKQRHGPITAVLDFLPEYSEKEWEASFEERWNAFPLSSDTPDTQRNPKVEDFFLGILHKKLNLYFIRQAGLKPETLLHRGLRDVLKNVWLCMKHWRVAVEEANSFEHAQVCAGGIPMEEITLQMESKKAKGLFFAGEMLDVDGRCGGYNLQWAWTSGYLAGHFAAASDAGKGEMA